jgi:pimeloyl-ACP methyl ester carboxylesterase
MDGTGILFEPLLELLPADLEAKVVSYPVNEPCGYQDLLGRVLAALPNNDRFILLGESFSGPLAIMAADARPRGLQGVVLCAAFVRNPVPWLARFSDVLARPMTLAMVPAFIKLRVLMGARATPRLRSLFARAEALVSPDVIAARIKAVLRVDVSDELRRCPVPVLYLRGQHDRLVPARCSELIVECKSDSHVVSVSAPHLVLQTNPADALAAIQRFIAST